MTGIYIVLWASLLVLILAYFYKFGLSHIYDYRVGEDGVEFLLARFIPLFTIKFASIESAREIRIFVAADDRFSSIFTSIVLGNRLAAGLVILKMRVGPFRYIGLTPADRKIFLADLVKNLSDTPARPY